jgi:hypothetical protein
MRKGASLPRPFLSEIKGENMDIEKVKINQKKMKEMADTFGDKYYDLFGYKVMKVKGIQKAIDECYKELIEEVAK